ncbi:hypothetical protein [Fictibacillus terranigra]|uniref:DUF4432 domain-containing protein n=1 Tax=Fictibacillus terranigra TaxID=3058424 RepID=A0ABT8EAK6_9BACL|nr:hypothetical protein [Fictibacillus sp. CENA-BCM004]MDN4074931.1 hypothetical protein [Fictibacillus sp. CENA-BCM004]
MLEMRGTIELQREFFKESKKVIYRDHEFTASLFRYPSGVEAIELTNSRGRMVVLPYMGQIIWDLEFDGTDLKMKNMFSQPKKVNAIVDTYGCFAFHSGLIANVVLDLTMTMNCTVKWRVPRWTGHGWKSVKKESVFAGKRSM